MRTFSQDLRQRVLWLDQKGYSTRWIAQTLQVSSSWVRRVKQRWREHGEAAARPRGGSMGTKIDPSQLQALIDDQPDATLEELRDRLGVDCSLSTVWNMTRRLKQTFKKSPSMPPSKIAAMSRKNGLNGGMIHGG